MSSKSETRWISWRYSIRTRLTLWYGGVLAVAFVFLGLFLYRYFAANLISDFDLSLRSTAEAVSYAVLQPRTPLMALSSDTLLEAMEDPEFLSKFFQLFDPLGKSLSHSKNLANQNLPLSQEAWNNALKGEMTFETLSGVRQDSIRVLTFPVIRDGILIDVLQVGGSLQHVDKVLTRLRLIVFFAFPMVLLLALSGGWLLTNQVLKPVGSMTQVARQITAGDLSRRIPIHKGRDELAHLAETFNAMIERMEDSILRLRQFYVNTSHALRTPLTILKGEAEMALRHAKTVKEYQETVASGLEEIDRISKIVDDLFTLSKAALEEVRLEMKPVQLDALIAETVSQMELLAHDKKVDLAIAGQDPVTVTGDVKRLRELLFNLIENAIQYTPSGGRVVVSLAREEKHAVIAIADTGIGIPDKDLPKIYERFYRSNEAQAMNPKGSGLGLPICLWIVTSHGGQIEAQSKLGKGTTFTVRFPRAAD
jgi:heavy metal sensor kinase